MTEEELLNIMELWRREEMKPVTQYEVALHEAGHAVMSVFCRVGLDKVRIKWPEINGSHCTNTTRRRNGMNIIDELNILYAGPIAMAQGGELRALADDRFDGSDMKDIKELVDQAFPKNKDLAQLFLNNALTDALELVNTEWMQREIQAVAHALCEKGQLSGRQVRRICKASIE